MYIVSILYPFSQFCEIDIPLLSLQKQPNTASNLFQRGVEYGKYVWRPGVAQIKYLCAVPTKVGNFAVRGDPQRSPSWLSIKYMLVLHVYTIYGILDTRC